MEDASFLPGRPMVVDAVKELACEVALPSCCGCGLASRRYRDQSVE
jgi:hypothetical protein